MTRMMKHRIRRGAGVLVLVLLGWTAACESPTDDRTLVLDAVGSVRGAVFFDLNGSGELEPNDDPFPGVPVQLVLDGTRQTVAVDTTDQDGLYTLTDVPVGTYRLLVDSTLLADTLEVVALDTTAVTVTATDTLQFVFGLSFPVVTIQEARSLPVGRKVFIEGWALNSIGLFGDTTVHVTDTVRALRTTRVERASLFPGDSVRLLGRTDRRRGQPTLDRTTVIILSPSEMPPPVDATTDEAREASGGVLDAEQVLVRDAAVQDTATVDGAYHVTVDDGSGPLVVVIRETVNLDREPLVPDAILDEVRGVLVPTEDGTAWRLRPRFQSDVRVGASSASRSLLHGVLD